MDTACAGDLRHRVADVGRKREVGDVAVLVRVRSRDVELFRRIARIAVLKEDL